MATQAGHERGARSRSRSTAKDEVFIILPREHGVAPADATRKKRHSFVLYSLAVLRQSPIFSGPQLLRRPCHAWEWVKIGNCGSPIETEAAWPVITHGIGPMQKYCIGALLPDLHDPSRLIGELREPLLQASGAERQGYVPNVVYTCGALVHHGRLVLPYGLRDTATTVVSIELAELIAALCDRPS